MSKFKENHRRRVEKVKEYTAKNKVFVIIVVCVILFLIGNSLYTRINEVPDSDVSQSETIATEEVTEDEPLQWRFYWIDLWILLIGGGFCTVMILKERKKAKEGL